MDKEFFVQNVKFLCSRKGVKPTNVCREAGVGTSFLSDINRGQVPSVDRVQLLAQYLGVTTSELLGEALPGAGPRLSPAEMRLVTAYSMATAEDRGVVDLLLGKYAPAGSKKKTG